MLQQLTIKNREQFGAEANPAVSHRERKSA